MSDWQLQPQDPGGCLPVTGFPSAVEHFPAQGVAQQQKYSNNEQLPGLALHTSNNEELFLLQAAPIHCLKETDTPLNAGERIRPLRLRGRRGRRAQVQGSDPFPSHTDPSPLQPTRAPGPGGSTPTAQPQSARASLTISPSSSPHHRACAARAPAEPLHGSLFDSSYPDTLAPPPRDRVSRSARG